MTGRMVGRIRSLVPEILGQTERKNCTIYYRQEMEIKQQVLSKDFSQIFNKSEQHYNV